MKVKIVTLGCKVNQYESQAMLEALLGAGHAPAGEGERADLVLLNTCTVTAEGDRKARQTLRRLRRDNPEAVVVLCGCWPQAFPEEAAALLEADIVLGTADRRNLLPRVEEFLRTGQRLVAVSPHGAGETYEPLEIRGMTGRARAFLKIEDGCNQFCSYCIIPTARGRVRSRSPEDIRQEVARLARAGHREIVLTGINLSSYGRDLGLNLADAVQAAQEAPGDFRLRLSSLEPELLTDDILSRLRECTRLCPHFPLALQSGSDSVLRRMGRRYDTAQFAAIADRLRQLFPGCSLTTDIMVGFPGETEEEFAQSLAFTRRMAFARAHVFAYSPRPGTRAAQMENQVPNAVKEARSAKMRELTHRLRRAHLESRVGSTARVLLEQERSPGVWEGYGEDYTPVLLSCPGPMRGEFADVRLTAVTESGHCKGELLSKE